MTNNQIKSLRILVIAILVLLAFQFEFGMAVNLSPNLSPIPPFAFSVPAILAALQTAGYAAVVHAWLGVSLVLVALVNLGLSISSRVRSVWIWGLLGFISIAVAALNGVLFVISGFQNDGVSHGMATFFILSFTFFFLELYSLKGSRVL